MLRIFLYSGMTIFCTLETVSSELIFLLDDRDVGLKSEMKAYIKLL